MCEIAVVDTEQFPITAADQLAYRFHEQQGDGLGMVAVYRDGDRFQYETYKSTQPDWFTVHDWYERHYDAWRIIIHGRAGTCGGVNREAAHPIHVDCEMCDVDYVVHNGSIRKHRKIRPSMANIGHEFTTKVDSEIIAHKVGEIPETVSDHNMQTYSFSGNLNYLVLSDDGILVRVSRKYALTDEFTMTCSITEFDSPRELGFKRPRNNEWMLLEPDADEDNGVSIETKDRPSYTGYNRNNNTSTKSKWRGYTASAGQSNQRGGAYRTSTGATYEIEYTDLLTQFEHIVAVKVAPGVIKVIDTEIDKEDYVFRRDEPELYYYYADETAPNNIETLQELADRGIKFERYDSGQTTLDEFAEPDDDDVPVDEIAAEAAAREVAALDNEVTMEEAATISDEVQEMISGGNAGTA